MSLMGVDVGTTGVKAVVFDENGSQLALAYEEYDLRFPFPSASELNPDEVTKAAFRVIKTAASEVRTTNPVMAIGVASQGEAFTPVDASGRALANAMTSSDARAADYVQSFSGNITDDELYRITGHTPSPIYSLYKLLWIKDKAPDVFQKTNKLLFFSDLIAYALTGEAKTDPTMAARSMMFDVTTLKWSDKILEAAEVPIEKLPEVMPCGGVVGNVKRELAAELELSTSVTVSVAGHDQPVGALGCGAASPGSASYAIGTVECVCPSMDRIILSPALMSSNLAIYPHVLPNTYTSVAFNTTGGSVLKWVRDNIATDEAAAARRDGEDPYTRIIAAASDKPSNLILIPNFGPTGTPHFDSTGTGVLFGLNLSTRRSEVLRAVLEGITYEMKWNLSVLNESGLGPSELRVIGGGSKSDIWMQIKADILGVPLTTMKVSEATCMGSAILAGQGRGLLDAAEASQAWAASSRTFEPRTMLTSQYEERFQIYRELYNSLKTSRQMLHTLKGSTTDD